MDITDWNLVADTREINPGQINLKDNPVSSLLSRSFSVVVRLAAALNHAYRVERQAKHLYAMSNKDLDQMGIQREEIPTHLSKTFSF